MDDDKPAIDKPSIGRIVHYRGPEGDSHGEPKLAPAIVTAVYSDQCVNLTVFPDNGIPRLVTSVCHESMKGDRAWLWPART